MPTNAAAVEVTAGAPVFAWVADVAGVAGVADTAPGDVAGPPAPVVCPPELIAPGGIDPVGIDPVVVVTPVADAGLGPAVRCDEPPHAVARASAMAATVRNRRVGRRDRSILPR